MLLTVVIQIYEFLLVIFFNITVLIKILHSKNDSFHCTSEEAEPQRINDVSKPH